MYRSPIRSLNLGTQPDDSVDEQGMVGDFVDSVQRGFYQGMAGTFETIEQLTGYGGGMRNWLNERADAQISEMSEAGQNALTQQIFTEDENGDITFGEGALNGRAWLNYLGQGVGTIGSFLGTGGAGGALAKGGVKLLATAAGKQALKTAATKEAAKLGFKGKAKDIVANGAVSVVVGNGMIANSEREKYQSMSFQDLQKSPAFSDMYWQLREDPNNQQYSDEQIGVAARNALAEQAADRVFYDPKLTAVNTIGGLSGAVGGRGLGITGNIFNPSHSLKGGLVKGFAIEGTQEGSQGGVEALVSNEVYRDLVDPNYDITTGVASSALNEGVIGGVLGGTVNGAEGFMAGRRNQNAIVEDAAPVEQVQQPEVDIQPQELSPEQRAVEEPITGNTNLDTELNRLDDSNKAVSDELAGAKQRKIENELSARRTATRAALQEKGVLPVRNEQQNILDLARAYDPDRYQSISRELSNPDIDANPDYAEQLEGELIDMARQAAELNIDPLQTSIDRRVDANRRGERSPEQILRQRLLRYGDNGVLPDAEAAYQQAQAVEQQQSTDVSEDVLQQQMDVDARAKYGLPNDYQPTEAAQRVREEQGIALRDELEYQDVRQPVQPINPSDGPTEAAQRIYRDNVQQDINLNQQSIPARRDMEAARIQQEYDQAVDPQQQLSDEMLNRLASERVSNFSNRPASMRLREEGRKPIRDYAGMTEKTKGMSKRLKRRIQRAKGFNTNAVLSEFQNHEKRLQAFEAEAKRQAQIEAAKPENVARRQSAEALFEERMTSPQANEFKENLITEAMNSVNDIVDSSQGTVLEIDGNAVSLPEVKRQLANGVRNLANKFISKEAVMTERLRRIKQQREAQNEQMPNVQPDPESMQEELQPQEVVQREVQSVEETQEPTSQVDDAEQDVELEQQPELDEAVEPTKETEEKPVDDQSKEKIEDFGEVLHGARKHEWGKFGDAISRDMTQSEIAAEPLSKSLPKPDLKKLSEDGVSNYHLALMTVLRGMLPSKPRKGYKLERWSDSVKSVRQLSKAIMDKDSAFDSLSLHHSPMSQLLTKISDDLTLDEIETLGNYETDYYNIAKRFNFKRKKSYGRHSIDAESIDALAPKAIELIRAQSNDTETKTSGTKQRVDMGIYFKRFTGDAFIAVKVGSRIVEVKSGFDSTKEARTYLNENRTALEDEVIARRKDAREQVRSGENRARDGIIEREGNVTPEDFTNAFGFRGVQFGNWVEGARRQQDLNNAYDSLVDLARLMGIPTRAISLGGKLGLAFGARGQGGRSAAAAHFEPGAFVINLTKVSGKGSLAHEWFHALDYHFGDDTNVSGRKNASAIEGLRPEMVEKWNNIKEAIHKTKLPERSSERDNYRSKPYWNTEVELVARSFETWVIEQNSHNGITNDYLANVLPDNNSSDYPYPTAKEMEQGISKAYSEFAQSLRTEVDAKGNVSVYSLYRASVRPVLSDPKKEEVQAFVKDIFKGSPDLAHAETMVEVVSSERYLPHRIQYQIFNDGVEGKVNGLYDPESKKVYLIADKIPSKEHAERFIFHELVGHHGLRSLFGDDIKNELANIRNMIGGKSGVLKLARSMGVDLSQYVDMTNNAVSNNEISTEQADFILFDELLAHVAERNQLQSAVGKLITKIKAWLRRHGFNTLASYGKSDLMELLTNIRTSLNNPPPTIPPSGKSRVNYSLSQDARPDVDKVLNTKQKNLVKRIKAAISGFAPIEALGRNKYAMLTLRQMGEVAGFIDKNLEMMIDGYQQEVNSMISTQNTLAEEAATISDELSNWAKKNRKAADQLFEFAHDATLADVDPSKPFASRTEELTTDKHRLERAYKEYGGSNSERGRAIYEELKEVRELLKHEPTRQKDHLRLKPIWGRLNAEQKAKFREMRDYYIKQGQRFDKALEENINRAVLDQKIRKEMLAKLRQRQELRAKGLYFPLARFGDYWIDFADKNGERQYMMFESKAEMETARDNLRDAGFEVKSGMKAQGNEGQQVSLPFVADVLDLIRSSKMNQHNADTLADQVYQMYLRTLPGRSLRRNFIHRKGVEGFSNDAIRVLADNGFKQSRQQARLDHMDILDNHLVAIKKYADSSSDNAEISRITEEMDKRHEWVRNPQRSAWAQKLTSLGFTWLLGLTPAAALVNLTQNLQVAIPVLGSKHGFAKSSYMMANTSKEFLSNATALLSGKDKKRGYGVMGNFLKGEELEAFRTAVKQGVIDVTQAADLAGLAENPNAKYSGTWNKAMNIIGWAFHNAEVFNREVTFMSAYRLAKEKFGDHQKAVDQAIKDTWESHFDYTSTNRARFMQSDLAAVALQFKQYSQNMTYYLWSNLAKSLKGETPEVKAQARKQLLSTLAMTFGIGGLGALPLSALVIAADAAQAAFGDDDEPWSAEVELKAMLSDAVGKENAALMWYGSLPSISGRISLNDLWVRSIDRDIDTDEKYMEYIKQGLGPVVGGIGFSFAQGLSDIGDDFGIRSAEKMSPKVVKDMLKMARYINEEGVFTRTGAQVVGDMSPVELAGQALGFSSGRANIQYDENNAAKNYEAHLTKRRSQLMNGYYTAYRLGDKQALSQVMEQIAKWNQSKYGRMNPITTKAIQTSIKARVKNLQKTSSGVRINDKYRSLLTDYDYF